MKHLRQCALVVTVLLAFAPSAWATGLGLYFEYGNVPDGQFDMSFGDLNYEEDNFGTGFSVDTNVATDSVFNYRLDVGYQRVQQDLGRFGTTNSDGLVLDNAFGFGVFRNEHVRLWIGPSVRLNFDFFDGADAFDFGVGAGPAIGLNIHTGDLISLGITTGYHFSYAVFVVDGSATGLEGYESLLFLKFHLLFRTSGDRF